MWYAELLLPLCLILPPCLLLLCAYRALSQPERTGGKSHELAQETDEGNEAQQEIELECDFVIVGGGCSSCSLVACLAAAGKNIAVVESGSAEPWEQKMVESPQSWFSLASRGLPVSR
eukprot:767162-Hanusia_phi.AAC.1